DHEFETPNATQYVPTLDQIIADAIHTDEPYKSIETGVLPYRGINMGTVSNNLAHRGPHNFLPPQRDPTELFNTLFGDGSPTGPEGPSGVPAEVSNALRRSVLDAVLDDAERLKMTVGTEDALRIDAHMESIRAIEQRIPVAEGDATSTGTTGGSTPMETCTPE